MKTVTTFDGDGFIECLPESVAERQLVDITTFGDLPFKVFIDPRTGERFDSKEFYGKLSNYKPV